METCFNNVIDLYVSCLLETSADNRSDLSLYVFGVKLFKILQFDWSIAGHFFHSAFIQSTIFVVPTDYGGMVQQDCFFVQYS